MSCRSHLSHPPSLIDWLAWCLLLGSPCAVLWVSYGGALLQVLTCQPCSIPPIMVVLQNSARAWRGRVTWILTVGCLLTYTWIIALGYLHLLTHTRMHLSVCAHTTFARQPIFQLTPTHFPPSHVVKMLSGQSSSSFGGKKII